MELYWKNQFTIYSPLQIPLTMEILIKLFWASGIKKANYYLKTFANRKSLHAT